MILKIFWQKNGVLYKWLFGKKFTCPAVWSSARGIEDQGSNAIWVKGFKGKHSNIMCNAFMCIVCIVCTQYLSTDTLRHGS
jgi:hypothetical protein